MSNKINKKPEDTRFDKEAILPGGMKAAKQDNINLLRRAVLANLLWEKIAYIDGIAVSLEIARLIPLCDPRAVADLVIEVREKQKLRHVVVFMIVEMCKHVNFRQYVSEVIIKTCTRVDMMTDLVALYWANGKKPLPNQMKKGLATRFNMFSEYQLAKYNRDGAVKLRDVLFLVHSKPTQGKEELFKRIANNALAIPDTWEVALSTGKDKRATWEKLINEGTIGGLAMLRNLNNMVKADVPKGIIAKGLDTLKSHMLLPLDFLKANRMVPVLSREIEEAMLKSYANLPKLPGKTLFIVDISGSMGVPLSGKSDFTRLDSACAMAMLAVNQCENYEIVITAGNDSTGIHKSEHIKYPMKGFGIFGQLTPPGSLGGGGIFTRQCLEWCKVNVGSNFDRIIVFSDSQDTDHKNKVPAPFGVKNYIVDVSSNLHGVNYKGVWSSEITGFSENFLTYIAAMEGLENMFSMQ